MIDSDEEYYSLKKLCNNAVYQSTQPAPYDKTKIIGCPHWVFSEEYALTHKDFKLYWHTPGVMDGGIYCEAKFSPTYDEHTLFVKIHQDGFIDMGVLKDAEIPLERYKEEFGDIDEEDAVEKCLEDWGNDYIQWFKDNFGEKEFNTAIKENNLVDLDALAEACTEADGPANFLARYDGKEIELPCGYYCYRSN